jgi:hypothetical protein
MKESNEKKSLILFKIQNANLKIIKVHLGIQIDFFKAHILRDVFKKLNLDHMNLDMKKM